jgi:hypothetical protein
VLESLTDEDRRRYGVGPRPQRPAPVASMHGSLPTDQIARTPGGPWPGAAAFNRGPRGERR